MASSMPPPPPPPPVPTSASHQPITPQTPPSRPVIPRSKPPRPTTSSSAASPHYPPRRSSQSQSQTPNPYPRPPISTASSSSSTVPLITPQTNTTHPLMKKTALSTASSTTSLNGLGMSGVQGVGARAAGDGTGGGGGGVGALSNNGVVMGTPKTGASKMAAAAKRGQAGIDGLSTKGQSVAEDEDHPLSEKSLKARGYQTIQTQSRLFHLPTRWSYLRSLGQGAYGLVISVQDNLSGEPVAVKCITKVFDKVILARRALREITLLRHFGGHENLTGLIDLDNVWDGYNEIYLYMEPMEADLHQIIRSGQPLSGPHIQFFVYQILRGMKYVHSANVIHRDLKPGNLLVNANCELKICDFGLARGFKPVTGEADQGEDLKMTEYVATRWYRAPEVMLSNRRYTTAIDVWSIGCILAELLDRKPLFKGKDYVDQLNLILEALGTPDEETLKRTGSEKANAYIRTLPITQTIPFNILLPYADPAAIEMLNTLLVFDPTLRPTVSESIRHPYMAIYHDPLDEDDCPEIFNKWREVESYQTIDELRVAISKEIKEYREEVRMPVEWDEEDGVSEGGISPRTSTSVHTTPVPGVNGAGFGFSNSPLPIHDPHFNPSPHTTISSLPLPVPLPHPHPHPITRTKSREISPSPFTSMSEETSSANPLTGRTSRRQSGHSNVLPHTMSRRPTSFLFSGGMTALSAIQPSTGDGASGGGVGNGGVGGWNGRRSRAPSGAGGMIRPLIRQLSTVGLEGNGNGNGREGSGTGGGEGIAGDGDEECPPMTVSPSDAPPSEVPKHFG